MRNKRRSRNLVTFTVVIGMLSSIFASVTTRAFAIGRCYIITSIYDSLMIGSKVRNEKENGRNTAWYR